jgi:hypothetical protein
MPPVRVVPALDEFGAWWSDASHLTALAGTGPIACAAGEPRATA